VVGDAGDRVQRSGEYYELMRAVCVRYERQEAGDLLDEYTVLGRAQQQLVQEVLSDYRETAELALQDASETRADAQREAVERIGEVTAFLGDGQPREESTFVA
jgi:hypothetical protein